MKFSERTLKVGELLGAGLLPIFTVIAGILAFIPAEVAAINPAFRFVFAGLVFLTAIFCGYCVLVQRSRRKSAALKEKSKKDHSVSRAADRLLDMVAKQCVSAGSWRVTLFEETVSSSGKKAQLSRVWRTAQQPSFSPEGTKKFRLSNSVLRGMQLLELDDPSAPPVDVRVNFPDPAENRTLWRDEQKKFVGNRAKHLRMPSRAYGWRRIAPSQPGEGLYVLLIETTNPQGIERTGLESVFLDSIARALIDAVR